MKAVIAIDSFKGSLTSLEAGNAAAEGIRRAFPNADITVCAVADGGEGTVDALVDAMDGMKRTITALDPLGRPIPCTYGILCNGTAVIEMAAAAGLPLLTMQERNPLNTTTYGVGQIIADAVQNGCRRFIIGIGGSATNDGGVGMLQALGFDFLDKNGGQVPFGAKGLQQIETICATRVLPALSECSFQIACDVTNPLCGDNGCSAVYGPQKGADKVMIQQMDQWLQSYAQKVRCLYPSADPDAPGTGAAGGIGFAFLSFLNGELKRGIEIVLEEIRLDDTIRHADVVVTGEGRLDAQTVMGKTPAGVASVAKKYGKPVIAFSGCVTEEAGVCNKHGIDAFFPILRTVCTLEEALVPSTAYANLSAAAEQAFRLLRCAGYR